MNILLNPCEIKYILASCVGRSSPRRAKLFMISFWSLAQVKLHVVYASRDFSAFLYKKLTTLPYYMNHQETFEIIPSSRAFTRY